MSSCFSHGQLYTALSRVENLTGILVHAPVYKDPKRIHNVVYRELLQAHGVRLQLQPAQEESSDEEWEEEIEDPNAPFILHADDYFD